ncbi:MAG: carboxymuconolactone decarboxylase family protein [Cyanobacteria bacterium SZAS-4]|nr:carboxymuconolactone decarboxylase family protein [Cyanobacteria bacterium SZAS-4]
MTQRLDYSAIAPDGMAAFAAVHNYIAHSKLRFAIINLVYLRVSQINGCAYCVDMHTRDLLKAGVPNEKLVLLPVWHEASEMFSEHERAALAWCETVTNVVETRVHDEAYEAVRKYFSDKEVVDLTLAISLMNAYNRIAISFRATPAAVKELQTQP